VIVIAIAEALKSRRVMANDDSAHTVGDSRLPGIIFTQPLCGPPLTHGDTFGVSSVYGLPGIAAKVCADRIWVDGTFEYFRKCDRRNPELSGLIVLQPAPRRAVICVSHLVQEIDHERGVENALFHRRLMRKRSSPTR